MTLLWGGGRKRRVQGGVPESHLSSGVGFKTGQAASRKDRGVRSHCFWGSKGG